MKNPIIYFLILLLTSDFLNAEDCHWETVDTLDYDPFHTGTPETVTYRAIECADSNNCIAYCDLTNYYPWARVTTDGGKNWFNALKDTALLIGYTPGHPSDLAYPDTTLAIATVIDNYYWISKDKGITWKKKTIPGYENDSLNKVDFLNKDFGIITSYNKNDILITKDGAKTWKVIHVKFPDSLQSTTLGSFFILDTNTFFFEAILFPYNDHFLVKTSDQGNSWEFMPPDSGFYNRFYPNKFYFLNKDTGFATGGVSMSYHPGFEKEVIRKTTDGGKSWITKYEGKDYFAAISNTIKFFDSKTGITFNNIGKIYRTDDGGETWFPDPSTKELGGIIHLIYYPNNYYAVNSHLIFATSGDNLIFKYSCGIDGVAEWQVPHPETELYPNPATNYFNLKNENNIPPDKVEIYSVLGVLVSEINPASTGELRIGNLPAGMYYLRIYYGNKIESKLLNVRK